MMGSVGFAEIAVIAIVALFVFGPDRLPELSKKAGQLIAKARRATKEFTDAIDRESGETTADLRSMGAELKGVKDDLTKAAGSMFDLSSVGESSKNKPESSSETSSEASRATAEAEPSEPAEEPLTKQAKKQVEKQAKKQQVKNDEKAAVRQAEAEATAAVERTSQSLSLPHGGTTTPAADNAALGTPAPDTAASHSAAPKVVTTTKEGHPE